MLVAVRACSRFVKHSGGGKDEAKPRKAVFAVCANRLLFVNLFHPWAAAETGTAQCRRARLPM